MMKPTPTMTGIAKRIDSGTAQSMIASSGLLAEKVVDIGHIHLERIAEKVLLRFVDDRMAQRQKTAEGHGAEGADHEKRAVGEVHHAEGAENQRQAKGDQRIGGSLVEAVENLEDNCVHGPTFRMRLRPVGREAPGRRDPARRLLRAYTPGLQVPREPPANCG